MVIKYDKFILIQRTFLIDPLSRIDVHEADEYFQDKGTFYFLARSTASDDFMIRRDHILRFAYTSRW